MGIETLIGTALGGIGSIIEGQQRAKQRRRALNALREIIANQNRDFATAETALRAGEQEYRGDPRRAATESRLRGAIDTPAITPEMLSILKQGAIDAAGREAGGTDSAVREQLQRAGLSYSGLGAGALAGARARAYGRAAGIGAQYDVEAAQSNRAARERAEAAYDSWTQADIDRLLSFGRDKASLYGSRDYSASAMLAAA